MNKYFLKKGQTMRWDGLIKEPFDSLLTCEVALNVVYNWIVILFMNLIFVSHNILKNLNLVYD